MTTPVRTISADKIGVGRAMMDQGSVGLYYEVILGSRNIHTNVVRLQHVRAFAVGGHLFARKTVHQLNIDTGTVIGKADMPNFRRTFGTDPKSAFSALSGLWAWTSGHPEVAMSGAVRSVAWSPFRQPLLFPIASEDFDSLLAEEGAALGSRYARRAAVAWEEALTQQGAEWVAANNPLKRLNDDYVVMELPAYPSPVDTPADPFLYRDSETLPKSL